MYNTHVDQLLSTDLTDAAWKNTGKYAAASGLLCIKAENTDYLKHKEKLKLPRPCLLCNGAQLPLSVMKKHRREIGNLKPARFLAVEIMSNALHACAFNTTNRRSDGDNER